VKQIRGQKVTDQGHSMRTKMYKSFLHKILQIQCVQSTSLWYIVFCR